MNFYSCSNEIKKDAIEEEKPILMNENLPRYLISQNNLTYEILFKYLTKSKEISEFTWSILIKIPTSSQIYSSIEDIENYLKSFNNLKKDYILLYHLTIIEYLLNNSKEWQAKFIELGGVNQLGLIFNDIIQSEDQNFIKINIMINTLRILKQYFSLILNFNDEIFNYLKDFQSDKLLEIGNLNNQQSESNFDSVGFIDKITISMLLVYIKKKVLNKNHYFFF